MTVLKWQDSEDTYKPSKLSFKAFLEKNSERLDAIENIVANQSALTLDVFIGQSALDQIKEHLSRDTSRETGGILVGKSYLDGDKYFTEIVGSIPAPYTVGQRTYFKLSPDCWQEMLKTQCTSFPETCIVGWYHSHPGFGVFLSGTDLETQRYYFKQIWQIAIVYDPIKDVIGFFSGESGNKARPILVKNNYLLFQDENNHQEETKCLPEPQQNVCGTESETLKVKFLSLFAFFIFFIFLALRSFFKK